MWSVGLERRFSQPDIYGKTIWWITKGIFRSRTVVRSFRRIVSPYILYNFLSRSKIRTRFNWISPIRAELKHCFRKTLNFTFDGCPLKITIFSVFKHLEENATYVHLVVWAHEYYKGSDCQDMAVHVLRLADIGSLLAVICSVSLRFLMQLWLMVDNSLKWLDTFLQRVYSAS